jgi:hypothetical protein
VTVHDAGVAGDLVFIAMEFVDGETLGAWLRAVPRSSGQILDVFIAAGRGLAAAHAAQIIHRDFKPENVMIGKDGSVRVTDFGLARLVHEDLGPGAGGAPADGRREDDPRANASVTRTGALLGTPAYMAPEQFRREPATARSDQFSFCVALHEALYGVRPALAHLQSNVAAPPSTDGAKPQRRGGTPQWLRNIVLRGLSPDPADRWGSMDELTRALARDPARSRRRWSVGAVAVLAAAAAAIGLGRASHSTAALCQAGPTHLADAWIGADASSGSGRRDALRAAFLATGVPGAADTGDRVASRLDRYTGGWLGMYRDACEATHLRGEQSSEVLDLRMSCLEDRHSALKALTDVLATADGQTVNKAVDAVGALPALDRCADVRLLRAEIEPPRDAKMRGQIDDLRHRATVAKALHDTGRNQEAVALAQTLTTEARAVGYQPLLAELLGLTCYFQESATFDAASVKVWEEAIWMGIRAKRDDLAADEAAMLAGMVGGYLQRPEEGKRWAELATALADRMGEGHERLRSWILQGLAVIAESTDPEAALRLSRSSLELKRKVLQPDDPDIGHSLITVAEHLHRTGNDVAAVEVGGEARRNLREAYGPTSAVVAQTESNVGEYLVALGRPSEALPLFREALSHWESQIGSTHPFLAYPLTGLGRALTALGQPADARPPLERALRLREAHDPNLTVRAETRFALAQALWATGDHRRAVDLAKTARQEYANASTEERAGKAVTAWLSSHE